MATLKRTLGDIRADIQTRLGFGMAGQAGVVNSPLIDSMIRSAQFQLYQQFEWLELKKVVERTTGTEQQFYDYPADCEPENIVSISIGYSGRMTTLMEGISNTDLGFDIGGEPRKYERRDQIELWPVPQTNAYTLRIEYIKSLNALNNNDDRTTINSEMVFLHALTNAKAHYRQPDAESYSSQLDALLAKLKAKSRSQTVWKKQGRILDQYAYPPTSDQVV
jgi:hypothetical protein